MRGIFQQMASRANWIFRTGGAIARVIMFFNRPLFKKRTNRELVNFACAGTMREVKRFFKGLGFTSIGSGYPHTRNQMWLNWRTSRNGANDRQLHARFRRVKECLMGQDLILVSVHFEHDWACREKHPADSWHPKGLHYDLGEFLLWCIITKKIGEGKFKGLKVVKDLVLER
jgi:hypothetical protein